LTKLRDECEVQGNEAGNEIIYHIMDMALSIEYVKRYVSDPYDPAETPECVRRKRFRELDEQLGFGWTD
jgi:hypothetical protein